MRGDVLFGTRGDVFFDANSVFGNYSRLFKLIRGYWVVVGHVGPTDFIHYY
jgi:hypothetical protein